MFGFISESSSLISWFSWIISLYEFLDATASNWNIADSGAAKKSDMIMHGSRHPDQTKPGLLTPAVQRSLNTSSKIL